ncbi:hypothetical protein ACROYT_G032988 [Oculina patagonica]
MTICGFYKLRAFFTRVLAVLVLTSFLNGEVNAFSVVRSTTPDGRADVDTFSNADASCKRVGCTRVLGSAGCKAGDCCICKCGSNTPNYLIHSKTCGYDDVEDCDFSTLPSESSEIEVKDMSKAGNVQFGGEAEGCSSGLKVTKWSYRLDKPQEIIGQPNNFRVITDGPYRWSLQWNTGLDAKYSGLILKFDLECIGQSQYTSSRCLLVKSKGNYTLSAASNSGPSQQVVPSDVAVEVTEKVEPTEQGERNDTEPDDVERAETAAGTKRELEEKNHSVVAVGVSLSLVVGVGLICVIVLRRSGSTWAKGRGKAGEPAYEEPIPAVKRNSVTFHNEFYDADCVLTIDGQAATTTNRMSRLGPLPPLPTEEGIYEEPVFIRSVGYQGLAAETKESEEQTKDEPKIEEEPPPVYNTLEPPSDDEDFV